MKNEKDMYILSNILWFVHVLSVFFFIIEIHDSKSHV